MKKYNVTNLEQNYTYTVKAQSPDMAMVTVLDKYYRSWFGPKFINGVYEIYNNLGNKLTFKIIKGNKI